MICPFGNGKRFASGATGFTNQLIGGWSINTIVTLQGGQPITLSCPTTVAGGGVGCYDIRVKGVDPKLGIHTDSNGKVSWIGNPAAFTQPCVLGAGGVPEAGTPTGCVPLTGLAALGGSSAQIPGPGFHRMDFSLFKNIPHQGTLHASVPDGDL